MPEEYHGWMSPEELKKRSREVREKMERGEALTTEEAGFLGAQASIEETTGEREEAKGEGRLPEFKEKHRVKMWTKGEETRPPHVSEEEKRRAEEIREKMERGEALTTEEAGVLGGTTRAEEAAERLEDKD